MPGSGSAPAEPVWRAGSRGAGSEATGAAHGDRVRPSSPPPSLLLVRSLPLLSLLRLLALPPASLLPASDARRERGCEAVLARRDAAASSRGVRRPSRKARVLCSPSDSSEPSVPLTDRGLSLSQPLGCCCAAASGPSLACGLRRPSPPPGEAHAPPSADRRACRRLRLASLERRWEGGAGATAVSEATDSTDAAAVKGGGSGEAAGGGATSTQGLRAAAGRRVPLASRRGERPPAFVEGWPSALAALAAAAAAGSAEAAPMLPAAPSPAADACSAASRARTPSLLVGWCCGKAANRCSSDASSAARPPRGTRRGVGSGRHAGGDALAAGGASALAPAVASPGTSRLPLLLPSRRHLMLSSRAPMEGERAGKGAGREREVKPAASPRDFGRLSRHSFGLKDYQLCKNESGWAGGASERQHGGNATRCWPRAACACIHGVC